MSDQNLSQLLTGETVWVVGGSVRDRLLGRQTPDLDLIVPNNPQSLAKKIAATLNGTAFPLDEERGIFRVTLPDNTYIDIAQQQGKTFEDDIDRRDFTINALAVPFAEWGKPSWKKHVIDRHKGLADLRGKKIRALGKNIFKEDPLRLLRAYRIAAELDFKIDTAARRLIAKNKNLIKKPAPERRRDELMRIFSTDRAYQTCVDMDKDGLLEVLFPEARALRKTAPRYYGKGGVLKHTLDSIKMMEEIVKDATWFPRSNKQVKAYLAEKVSGHPRSAHCKWALLLHDIGKPATAKMMDGRLRFFEHEHVGADMIPKMAERFRWSSDETDRYARLVRNHMRPGNLATHEKVTDRAIHRFFRDLGDDAIAMLIVSLGDHLTYLTPAQRRKRSSSHEIVTRLMVKRFYHEREKVLPPRVITGHDVMKTFSLKPSPLIGILLADVTDAQSEGKVSTKDEALEFLKGRVEWHAKNTPPS